MQYFAYPARFTTDEDGRVLVTFRDFAGATDGADRTEAMAEAVDFLESALAQAVNRGEAIPRASASEEDEILVSPSAVTAAQIALYTAMRQELVSNERLAELLHISINDVNRLLDLSAFPPLEIIERALAVLGHRITVSVDAAE
jgi:antitoxin HicB